MAIKYVYMLNIFPKYIPKTSPITILSALLVSFTIPLNSELSVSLQNTTLKGTNVMYFSFFR